MFVSDETVGLTKARASRFLDVLGRSISGENVLSGISLSAMSIKESARDASLGGVLKLWNVSQFHPSAAGMSEMMAFTASGLQDRLLSGTAIGASSSRVMEFISSRMGDQAGSMDSSRKLGEKGIPSGISQGMER